MIAREIVFKTCRRRPIFIKPYVHLRRQSALYLRTEPAWNQSVYTTRCARTKSLFTFYHDKKQILFRWKANTPHGFPFFTTKFISNKKKMKTKNNLFLHTRLSKLSQCRCRVRSATTLIRMTHHVVAAATHIKLYEKKGKQLLSITRIRSTNSYVCLNKINDNK